MGRSNGCPAVRGLGSIVFALLLMMAVSAAAGKALGPGSGRQASLRSDPLGSSGLELVTEQHPPTVGAPRAIAAGVWRDLDWSISIQDTVEGGMCRSISLAGRSVSGSCSREKKVVPGSPSVALSTITQLFEASPSDGPITLLSGDVDPAIRRVEFTVLDGSRVVVRPSARAFLGRRTFLALILGTTEPIHVRGLGAKGEAIFTKKLTGRIGYVDPAV